ncbi:MAG TPA: hypothetical protein DCP28_17305 [Cytophagales bacterium]|nr:hypothetical protein [Cytophagales bacterium]
MKNTTKILAIVALLLTCSLEVNAQRGPLITCSNVTNMLHIGTPYVNSVSLSIHQTVTWYTNPVCGATTYYWILQGGQQVSTNVPQITLSAQDLVWLPAGGCDDFNAQITFPTPWATVGTYATTFSVRSNLTSPATIPVYISGVEKCEEIDPFGDDDGPGGCFGG